jgi:hypothetical protein
MTNPNSPLSQPIHTTAASVGQPPWRENAFLAFWDPTNAIYGIVHVSTSPNAERRRARFGMHAATAPYTMFNYDLVEDIGFNTFTSDSIHFGMDGHVTARTEAAAVDLYLEPKFAYLDYSAGGVIPALVSGAPLRHYQQACTFHGTARIGERRIEVSGPGFRDRTWGFRNEDASFGEYIGLMAHFETFSVSFIKFLTANGGTALQGALLQESAREIRDARLLRNGAGCFDSVTLKLADGEELSIHRQVPNLADAWLWMSSDKNPGPSLCAYEEVIKLQTSRGEVGYGRFEQGIRRQLT